MQGQAITPHRQELPLAPATGGTLEHSVLTPGDVRKIIIKRKWVILTCLLLAALQTALTPAMNMMCGLDPNG